MTSNVAVLGGPVDTATEEVVPVDAYERLTAALAGTPTVVKVSHEELLDDGRADDDSVRALTKAARAMGGDGVELVVVSRAAAPALAVRGDDALLVKGPSLAPADTRGGDSMTAGLATALAQGEDVEAALWLGAAAGLLTITRHGLGSGSGEAVRTLAERVEITRAG